MANYTIIGGDGKEYGPVTEADIRQWIAEGRLNAQSSAKAEGDAEFRPLGLYPEFASVLAPGPGAAALPTAGEGGKEYNEGDYDLDIGASVSRSWTVFKANLGILVAANLLYWIVLGAFFVFMGVIDGRMGTGLNAQLAALGMRAFLAPLLLGPLTGGFYLLLLRLLRGERAEIGDLFVGLQKYFAPLFVAQLAVSLVNALFALPGTIMTATKLSPVLEKFQQSPTPDQMQGLFHQMMDAYQASLPVLLVCLIPAVFFQVSLMFALPLIVDRQLPAGAALRASFKMTFRHWWHVFGLVIVSGLISISGGLLCCVGLLLTLPLGTLIMMAAYESIFLRKKA